MPKAEPPRVAVHRGRADRHRGRALREGVRPAGRGLRSRRHRRARPPLGPRPPVHAVRDERHSARPARRFAPRSRAARCRPTPTSSPAASSATPTSSRSRSRKPFSKASTSKRPCCRSAARRPAAGSACSSATAKGQERIDTADVVLDCTGTYATPNWLGDGNIAAVGELAARPQIASGLEDVLGEKKNHYAGREHRARRRRLLRRDDDLRARGARGGTPGDVGLLADARAARPAAAAPAERPVQGARPPRGEGELARHALRRQPRIPPADASSTR